MDLRGSPPTTRPTDYAQFGPNALATHRVRASAVLFRQIRNPILVMLLAAALVSGLTGGGTNAVIIAVIVALSVGLGFFNEYRAEMAMEALRAKIRHEAEVRGTDARAGSRSRTSCPATWCRCASGPWCRPTSAC